MGLKTHAISSAFSYAFPFHKASFYMPKASFFMPKNAYEAKTELFNTKLFGIEKWRKTKKTGAKLNCLHLFIYGDPYGI